MGKENRKSELVPRKKKSRLRVIARDRVCDVCHDKALGYNYGGISCNCCRSFFHHFVLKNIMDNSSATYSNLITSCKNNGTCKIDQSTRRNCKTCRYFKCLSIGMEPAWVISDFNNRTKQSAKNIENCNKIEAVSTVPQVQGLSAEEFEIIHNIPKFYKKACELIPYNYISREKTEVLTPTKLHILTIGVKSTSIRRFVCLARMLPEFQRLSLHDQANLLRRSVLEMFIIRDAFTFNFEKRGSIFDNLPEKYPELLVDDWAGMYPEELTEMHIQLYRRIRAHTPDEASIMLLIPLVLFSDCGGNDSCTEFDDRPAINAAQEFYTGLLQKYLKHVLGEENGRLEFPRLLAKLVDITQTCHLYQGYPLKLTEDQVDKLHKHLLELQRIGNTSQLSDHKYFSSDKNNISREKPKDCCAKIHNAPKPEKTMGQDKNAPFLIHTFVSNPGQWGVKPDHFIHAPHIGVEKALMRRTPELLENPWDSLVKNVSDLMIS